MRPWDQQVKRLSAFGQGAFVLLLDVSFLEDEGVFDEALRSVREERRKKVLSHALGGGARLCLGAGLLMQLGLQELTGKDSWEIRMGEEGKPYLAEGKGFFNLSHSGTLAMGIFSDREVGCDVQEIVAEERIEKIYRRFFHPEEISYLDGQPKEERVRAFTRLWSLKESFVKASGEGLKRSFDSFCISLEPGPMVRGGECLLWEIPWEGYAISAAMDQGQRG